MLTSIHINFLLISTISVFLNIKGQDSHVVTSSVLGKIFKVGFINFQWHMSSTFLFTFYLCIHIYLVSFSTICIVLYSDKHRLIQSFCCPDNKWCDEITLELKYEICNLYYSSDLIWIILFIFYFVNPFPHNWVWLIKCIAVTQC